MNEISAEYKKIMEEEKQLIKKLGKRVVDSYETEDFLVIVSISKNHIVWEESYFKLSRQWSAHAMQ